MKTIKAIKSRIKSFLRNRRMKSIAYAEDLVGNGFKSQTYINKDGKLIYNTNMLLHQGVVRGEIYAIGEWSEVIKKEAMIPEKTTVLDFCIYQNQF